MNPLALTGSAFTTQVISSAIDMVKEISQYKCAIAEIDAQRDQMRKQAEIMQHQIDAQLCQALKRIKHLSKNFALMLEQNKQLIQQHCQREMAVQQQSILIIQQMALCSDLESKKILMQCWQDLLQQMNLNREESARLQAQLMDAHQQLGISLSQREQSFKDVY